VFVRIERAPASPASTTATPGASAQLLEIISPRTNAASYTPIEHLFAALAREGTEVALSRSPEDFAAFLNEDAKFWVRLVKESGATIE